MGYFKLRPNENFFADKILKWIVDILIVIVLGVLTIYFMGQDIEMSGNSMSESINNKEVVLINKLSYHFTSPKQYDIIVFCKSGGDKEDYQIKRIIGVPGDKIRISDGFIYVNNEKIDYNEGKNLIVSAGLAGQELTLSENEYFVMGDNWNYSEDSRSLNIGNIKEEEIIGKVWFRATPFKDIGFIK